ncbi:hypothetical protein N0V90_005219 [Kalmusia sp. IMI 367209]|nr:hypothetical protein N0V90_005219 [Kalmusia sp. IMI 367209]
MTSSSGPRCKICHQDKLILGRNPGEDGFCPACNIEGPGLQADLFDKCLWVIEEWYPKIAREREWWKQYKSAKTESDRRVLMGGIVESMCAVSLVDLNQQMKLLFVELSSRPSRPLVTIQELRFATSPFWNSEHYVFVITTPKASYVFDPTGIQFGPDWPLVQEYEKYREDRIQPGGTQVWWAPIGTMAEAGDSESFKRLSSRSPVEKLVVSKPTSL